MDKNKLIIIIEIVFITAFISIVVFFTLRYLFDRLELNRAKEDLTNLIKIVNNYSPGEYKYENGAIYNGNKVMLNDLNFKGNSILIKDQYGINGKFLNKKSCVYKTSGNKEIKKYNDCEKISFEKGNINYTQNKAQITLFLNGGFYKVTKDNELPNEWDKTNNESIIITLPYEGSFYIWIKNSFGVVMDPVLVSVTCELGNYEFISNTLLYCAGSSLKYNNYLWHVISDINGELKIFMDSNQLDKMSHCQDDISNNNCYYKTDTIFESYKWSNSKINKYLNGEFLLSFNTEDILEENICDEPSGTKGCADGDGCAGYLKEQINNNNYKCKNYTSSKIRLLTYNEYEYIVKNTKDRSWLYNDKVGDFWLMNGYSEKGYFVSKINSFGQYYMDEYSDQLLNIRPVLIIKK